MSLTIPDNARGPILDLGLPTSIDPLDIVLRNKTTGKTLAINLAAGWDGDDLALDFFRRTIKDQAGADRSALLDPSDNKLWVPEPLIAGTNDIEIEAATAEGYRQFSQTRSPQVAVSVADANPSWTNPSDVVTSNDQRATIELNSSGPTTSELLRVTNFGFEIPLTADVANIVPQVEHSRSGVACSDQSVALVAEGAVVDSLVVPGGIWPAADATQNYTGYDGGLLPADVNASDFGFQLSAQIANPGASTARIDHMPMTVYYVDLKITATLRWEKGYY